MAKQNFLTGIKDNRYYFLKRNSLKNSEAQMLPFDCWRLLIKL